MSVRELVQASATQAQSVQEPTGLMCFVYIMSKSQSLSSWPFLEIRGMPSSQNHKRNECNQKGFMLLKGARFSLQVLAGPNLYFLLLSSDRSLNVQAQQ